MPFPHQKREDVIFFLKSLQAEIIHAFETFEPTSCFEKTPWNHKEEGGGTIALLRGEVFEKAAVNWSGVGGPSFPMSDGQGSFFATGISIITHAKNPHAPTAHFNIRFIETEKKFWFGGGYDLTPMGFPYDEDTKHFHETAKNTLDAFDKTLYPLFSKQAKEYFFIPHYAKERGVGGIFFDHFNRNDFEADFNLWKAVGTSFLKAVLPIYQKRTSMPYNASEKETQLKKRAHYVEFNLLYDRGTKFGFSSGGNPEAILCSMPPLAMW